MIDYLIHTSPGGSSVVTEHGEDYFLDVDNGHVTLTHTLWDLEHSTPATQDLVLDIDACLSVLSPQAKGMWQDYGNALREAPGPSQEG